MMMNNNNSTNPNNTIYGNANRLFRDNFGWGRGNLQGGGGGDGGRGRTKFGHRETKNGFVHYKQVSNDELKKSLQFGIVHFLSQQNRRVVDRDLLMQDFPVEEIIIFPR